MFCRCLCILYFVQRAYVHGVHLFTKIIRPLKAYSRHKIKASAHILPYNCRIFEAKMVLVQRHIWSRAVWVSGNRSIFSFSFAWLIFVISSCGEIQLNSMPSCKIILSHMSEHKRPHFERIKGLVFFLV